MQKVAKVKEPTPRHGRRRVPRGNQSEEPDVAYLPSGRRHELKLFLLSFLATLATVASALLFDPFYETSDDIGMRAVVEGSSSGKPSEYLIFMSLLLGRGLKRLYETWPDVFWYDIYLYGCMVVAGTAITYALLRVEARYAWLAAAFVLASFWLFPLRPQFTISAGLCAAASIILIVSACLRPPETRSARICIGILATACFILAVLTRSQQAWFVLVSCLLVASPLLITFRHNVPWSWATLSIAAMLGGGLLAWSASNYEVQKDAELQKFLEFTAASAHVREYLDVNWDKPHHREVLQRLGWTKSDLRMFLGWFVINQEPVTTAKLQEIREFLSNDVVKRPGKVLKLAARELIDFTHKYLLLILAAGMLIIALPGRKQGLAALGWGCLVVAAACVALALARKGVPYRVSAPLVFGMISLSILWSLRRGTDTEHLSYPSLILAALLLVSTWTSALSKNEDARRLADVVAQDLRNFEPPNPNTILVWWSFNVNGVLGQPFATAIRPRKMIFIGWGLHSPARRELLSSYGITRLEKAVCGSADIVLVAPRRTLQILVDYLAERHGMKTYMEPVFEGHMLQYYRCKLATE